MVKKTHALCRGVAGGYLVMEALELGVGGGGGGGGFWGAVNFMAGLFNGVSECELKG